MSYLDVLPDRLHDFFKHAKVSGDAFHKPVYEVDQTCIHSDDNNNVDIVIEYQKGPKDIYFKFDLCQTRISGCALCIIKHRYEKEFFVLSSNHCWLS